MKYRNELSNYSLLASLLQYCSRFTVKHRIKPSYYRIKDDKPDFNGTMVK